MKKPKLKSLLISVAIPLLVGGASALLSGSFTDSYQTLKKPPEAAGILSFHNN